jgi:hypothetical protein
MAGFELRSTPTFRDLQGRFTKANHELLETRRDSMRELAKRYVTLAQEESPGGPGHTVAEQLGYQTFNDGETLGFRLTAGQIARWHISGTGIYGPAHRPIRPVKARFLHFFIGGEEFFRRSVRGVPPNKFPGRAYRRWLPGAREELAKISTSYVRKIAGNNT